MRILSKTLRFASNTEVNPDITLSGLTKAQHEGPRALAPTRLRFGNPFVRFRSPELRLTGVSQAASNHLGNPRP